METSQHYDIIIIGSGPGGEGAASRLSAAGLSVAIIEDYDSVGGGCLHWGTIPSKTLRHSVQQISDYRNNPLFGSTARSLGISYPDLLKAADNVALAQTRSRYEYYDSHRINIIHGFARFMDSHSLAVEDRSGETRRYSADKFIIATGSRPYHPDDVDFDHPRILDSNSVLRLDRTPESMIIYGAGVIGCEYASIFSTLGIEVILINTRDRLLGFLDDEISDALGYTLRKKGTVIRHNEMVESIQASDNGVTLGCQSGKKNCAEYLLWANGRTGNTDHMNLEQVGITPNHRGQITVNKGFQTEAEHIYAVGDVVGPPALASASFDQGRFVASCIADGACGWKLIEDIPTGIYTTPEISCIGRNETELTASRTPYESGRAHFMHIARAQITGHTTGMLKILFHQETLEILGIHCFGEQAAEIIHIGQAVMSQPAPANNLHYFAQTTFNYPTMAEAYRVAAIDGLQRVAR